MNPRRLLTLYVLEAKTLLRDRHVLIYSVALPAFLYPILVLGVFQAATLARGFGERRTLRVALTEAPDELERFLRQRGGKTLKLFAEPAGVARFEETLGSRGGPDAVLHARVRSGDPHLAPDTPVTADVVYSAARARSAAAKERLEDLLEAWRRTRLEKIRERLGAEEGFLDPVEVRERSAARPEEVGRKLAALLLPALLVLMTALGAYYPALDLTAGERERKTLETTLLLAVPRGETALAKYLAVTTAGFAAFALNFAGLSVTLLHLKAQLGIEGRFLPPLPAMLCVVGAAVLLAAFFAAVLLLLGLLARGFREGQALLSVVYLMALVPLAAVAGGDLRLDALTGAVPVLNAALVLRGALEGTLEPLPVLVTFLATAAVLVSVLALAARLLEDEGVLFDAKLPRFRRGCVP